MKLYTRNQSEAVDMYDLMLIPIRTEQGQTLQQISGFTAANPPRRAARSRSEDLLILSLIIQGGGSASAEMQSEWLDHLAQNFFKTSGSVTSALRSLIETLNLTMMERNLKSAREGGWTTGMINLAALHHRSVYIAQCGLTHAFTLTHEGLQHFHDPSKDDRGLGLSRTPSIRYFQADLGTGGYLFMTASPPDTWHEDLLLADGFPPPEKLRRRLLNQAPVDFRLDLVQIQSGEGQIKMQAPAARPDTRPPDAKVGASPGQEIIDAPVDAADGSAEAGLPQQDTQEIKVADLPVPLPEDVHSMKPDAVGEPPSMPETGDGEDDTPMPEEPALRAEPLPAEEPQTPQASTEPREPDPALQTGDPRPQAKPARKEIREEGLQFLAGFFDWWHAAWRTVRGFFSGLLARFLPEREEGRPHMSRGTLVGIAVLVPVVVTAIALGVYLARGQRLQYEYYVEQAQSAAQAAQTAEDPAGKRSAWYEVLNALDQAEEIRESDETAALRAEAQDALDILDGALRLAYQPALQDTLSSSISISEIVSYGMDLYLFDEASGWVIHAVRDNDIYEVDTDFLCAPGNFSGGALGAIVDMVSLPINNPYQAHILAIDEIGNVAYCSPGQDPIVQTLPGLGGEASEGIRIAYENNTLYVLHPTFNSVLVFSATNGQFLEPPENFFKNAAAGEIPDLSRVVDLDINGPELYLLQGEGSLVNCVLSGLPDNPVTCQNPVAYLDGRPGLEDQALAMPEGVFTTVFYTPPPTPLVNILDATHGEVYRFSLRFRLYQRIRPDMGAYELDTSAATAFTIGEIEPLAFIAFGNQVFYAYVE